MQLFEESGTQVVNLATEVTVDTRNNAVARGLINKELFLYNPSTQSWVSASSSCNSNLKTENGTNFYQRVCTLGHLALFGERYKDSICS